MNQSNIHKKKKVSVYEISKGGALADPGFFNGGRGGGGACYCKVVGLSSFTLNNIGLLSFRKGELKVTFTGPFQLKRSPL